MFEVREDLHLTKLLTHGPMALFMLMAAAAREPPSGRRAGSWSSPGGAAPDLPGVEQYNPKLARGPPPALGRQVRQHPAAGGRAPSPRRGRWGRISVRLKDAAGASHAPQPLHPLWLRQ